MVRRMQPAEQICDPLDLLNYVFRGDLQNEDYSQLHLGKDCSPMSSVVNNRPKSIYVSETKDLCYFHPRTYALFFVPLLMMCKSLVPPAAENSPQHKQHNKLNYFYQCLNE